MRRTGILAALLLTALAAPAGAWVETAGYDVPGGGIADCLRAAGPGRVALLGAFGRTSTSFDLLDAGSLTPAGSATFGSLASCPQVAAAGGEAPLLAAPGRTGGLQVAAPDRPTVTVPGGAAVRSVSLATAPGGAAVLAWAEGSGGGRVRLLAAVRRPGAARFGAPAVLDDVASVERPPATGIDTSGRATVAWIDDAPLRHASPGFVRVADAPAGGRFGSPRNLTRAWDGSLALAVTPQGRTLLAADGPHSLRAYERLPGAPAFVRVHLPPAGSTGDLAAAMNPDGGAVIAYRNDERSVFAIVRTAGGAFRDGGTVVPLDNRDTLSGAFVFAFSTNGRSTRPPYDGDAGRLSAALSPNGDALLTWVDDARDADAAVAQVARGTLAGGFGGPERLGSPCRSAAAARPLPLADGTLGVAWSDDARARVLFDSTTPLGGGRVHVARDLPGGAGAPQPLLSGPQLSAQLASSRALGPGEPLRIRVSCRARCDVLASATARTLPQPRWLNGGARGGEPFELGASTTLPAGGGAVLRLSPIAGVNAAGAAGAPRTPIAVIACTPGGPAAQHIELQPPRVRAPRPIPRLLDLVARRTGAGGAVRVTWRTSIPARGVRFLLYGIAGASRVAAQAQRAGHGRSRFAVTLHPRSGRQLDVVGVVLEAPQVLIGYVRQARVR